MSVSSHWRVAARLLAVLGLLALSGGGATARTVPDIQLTAAQPSVMMPHDVLAPIESGPFHLTTARHSVLAARWRGLQPVLHLETEALSLCDSNPIRCTPAASRFLAIIKAARARTGRAQIGEINRAINLAIRPLSDSVQFGVADVWMTPLMTFATGAGDCEDYAIAKYVALRQTGVTARDLRLVILHDRLTNEDHAVTAARLDGRWLILDNRRMALLDDTQVRNATPMLALDSAPDEASPIMAATPNTPPMPASGVDLTANDSAAATIPLSDLLFQDVGITAPDFPKSMAG